MAYTNLLHELDLTIREFETQLSGGTVNHPYIVQTYRVLVEARMYIYNVLEDNTPIQGDGKWKDT